MKETDLTRIDRFVENLDEPRLMRSKPSFKYKTKHKNSVRRKKRPKYARMIRQTRNKVDK